MENVPSAAASAEKIDVAYVAHLARIALNPGEQALFQEQLEHILDHVRKLNELNVDGIEPMAHAIPVKNRFRDDVPTPGLDHDDVMANAPESRHEQFFVPRILE
ncbi:MAG TPA: Asp-tRNA(Asn)/Glu-tRNA(Gln) amidotransferase subunit GatC [Kiritimatiellia bacterium]|nr:Asp-tRNA(Asn)/Glu-tRNA(Gln) amidotransferase subunit GatC [Kiritimatiellia bacterium]HMO99305.1 Asp-tRNA(Asn)/Glu-tRNA(Gln) amidotransferase subunit GatC [Kiritimatiellia bacterium]HMP95637.1 Asp-tRNA(Asn)/Glu-tRNA(Gln) amidotransferase subunit GatC [Kiritimatiellia bacterium]